MAKKKNKLKQNKFKFAVGDRVMYIGGLHPTYKNKEGTITKRANKKHRIDYSVLFEDGVQKNCIIESVLKEVIVVKEIISDE